MVETEYHPAATDPEGEGLLKGEELYIEDGDEHLGAIKRTTTGEYKFKVRSDREGREALEHGLDLLASVGHEDMFEVAVGSLSTGPNYHRTLEDDEDALEVYDEMREEVQDGNATDVRLLVDDPDTGRGYSNDTFHGYEHVGAIEYDRTIADRLLQEMGLEETEPILDEVEDRLTGDQTTVQELDGDLA